MECELPCQEAVFKSEHPFSEPLFCFTRGITLYKALQSLFESPPVESPQQLPELKQMDFTVLDMFILIHGMWSFAPRVNVSSLTLDLVLFAFINTHMTLIGLLKRQGDAIQSLQLSNESDAGRSTIPEDSILGSIRTALTRWRDHWVTLRSQVSPDEWASMGFYRTGYNFWLVSQLLITKKDAVDVIMRMEVNCEDKLEKLKVLLADEQD
ncbi:uncharacterized protein N7459_001646 [Penicillium hispanicum]|uniref:uncharacterized protein n=1 Tax=Penicillium hispanicum TaxID=1080232 RepID=UPI0025404906|nr:uncharacterized protein N7459_001646 [Penicillium hispanicum]KAJ5595438.1 hypothetical protein N7459_001646 [Penicillium hispanicum]